MAVFACYIQKEDTFQGAVRPFGNTYHFRTDLGQPFPDESVIQAVADAEADVTDTGIRFVRGTTWGPTDGPQVDNVIREVVELGFDGRSGSTPKLFRELCVLVSWPMPRSVPLNRRRWLRKYLRIGCFFNVGTGDDVVTGAAPIPQAEKDDLIQFYANLVTDPVTGIELPLCNAEGELTNGDPFIGDYLITRQIGS